MKNTTYPNFLELEIPPVSFADAFFHILPVPLEKSVSYGTGTAKGPQAILQASLQLEAFDGRGIPAAAGIYTHPPVKCGSEKVEDDLAAVAAEVERILAKQGVPIILGGEHTVSLGALQAFAAAQGMALQNIKPHGALYNMAAEDIKIWDAVAEVIAAVDPQLVLFVMAGPWRQELETIGVRHGIRMAFEFFGDRAYNPDGTLVSRKLPGAVIHDHELVAEKVLKMVKEGKVVCIDGTEIELAAETICVHGDNPAALDLVRNIHETLEQAGVEIAPPATVL